MIIVRVAAGLLTLLVASMLIFAIVQVLPGSAADVALGRNATPEKVQELNEELHLTDPLPSRYLKWLGGMLTGDLGLSTAALVGGREQTVSSQISSPLVNSLALTVITLIILIPLALFLGAIAAIRAGRPSDYAISTASIVFSAMPEFLVGTMLIALFFTSLELLPPVSQFLPGESPLEHINLLVLPILTLLLVSLGYTVRLIRAATLDTLKQNYVAVARIHGLRERRIIWRYALRNSLAPSVQALALTAQYLVGGIVIVESVFDYPGIGNLLVEAVQTRDVQTVMVISAILAAIYVAINIVADVIIILLSPKLRTRTR
ncbi:MAG: ABC transporter permease [Solirubrobacterales bacterium]